MTLSRLFHPLTVLLCALAAALVFALWIVGRCVGEERDYLLDYCVPGYNLLVTFMYVRFSGLFRVIFTCVSRSNR